MSTIKELAETCGVSEQAIRKWCARNQVAKDVAQRYIIDKTTETAILQHYPMRRKTPCFSYGDIRRVHRIYVSN